MTHACQHSVHRRIRRTLGVLAAPLPVFVLALPVAHAATPARTALAGTAAARHAVPRLAGAVRTGSVAADAPLSLEVSLTPREPGRPGRLPAPGLRPRLAAVQALPHRRAVRRRVRCHRRPDLAAHQVPARPGPVGRRGDRQPPDPRGHRHGRAGGEGLRRAARAPSTPPAATSSPTPPRRRCPPASPRSSPASPGCPTPRSGRRTTTSAPADAADPDAAPAGAATPPRTPAPPSPRPRPRGGYNLTSPIAAGDNGSGQTVGLVEFSAYSASAVAGYNSKYSLGASPATVVKVAGGTTDTSGSVEDELDIEVINALAPKAAGEGLRGAQQRRRRGRPVRGPGQRRRPGDLQQLGRAGKPGEQPRLRRRRLQGGRRPGPVRLSPTPGAARPAGPAAAAASPTSGPPRRSSPR